MSPTAANIKENTSQKRGGVAEGANRPAMAAARKPPRETRGGPLGPAPRRPGAGARFQKSRRAVHD